MSTVGVSIASIPPRARMLARAVTSVCRQTRLADQISIHVDHDSVGAADAKNAALQHIETDWVAFLDDDDELLPIHLEHLLACAEETGADLVYPWYRGINWKDLFSIPDGAGNMVTPEGQPFLPLHADFIRAHGNFIPSTVLARTEAVKAAGGFRVMGSLETDTCDDWGLWIRMLDNGAKFVHLNEVTWTWNGHPAHTSGRPWATVAAYKQAVAA